MNDEKYLLGMRVQTKDHLNNAHNDLLTRLNLLDKLKSKLAKNPSDEVKEYLTRVDELVKEVEPIETKLHALVKEYETSKDLWLAAEKDLNK